LPQCDADGRRVIFNLANKVDPSRHTSADIMKTFIATFETLLADPENQVKIKIKSQIIFARYFPLAQFWSICVRHK
jgi:hypothetical protein